MKLRHWALSGFAAAATGAAILVGGAAGVGLAAADPEASTFPGRPAPQETYKGVAGYLPKGAAPDAAQFLNPPPDPDSPLQAADETEFQQTRKLADGPRGRLAAADADLELPSGAQAFDCAVGARLDPATTPTLLKLMARIRADAAQVYNQGKENWRRPRPFAGRDVETCVLPAERPKGYSYPSGHSTIGWAWALALAEVEPERASQILARGRAFGESRIVCGVHWESDVEAGRTSGAALFAVLSTDRAFQADLANARAELARARAASLPSEAQCRAEQGALNIPIYR